MTRADRSTHDLDPVGALQRWEASGAYWRVTGNRGGTVTIALLTCDGGEQVGELRCAEEEVRDVLAGRLSNDAAPG